MIPITAPFELYTDKVRPEWIDNNGHMNMGYYLVVFDHATDAFLDACGLTQAHRDAEQVSTFSLEAHINYLQEVKEGDPLIFRTTLLGHDAKRIHYIHEMIHGTEGFRAATNELMSLHVSRLTRRTAPMADNVQQRLATIMESHARLTPPPEAGRHIGLGQRRKG
ncbi:MAG: thioesterase family protein [Minwuia sp.]|nr:thioesterase family protein [Minwuia sp.]